ncbi:MAG TPA: FtsX-like permease family protein [Streptosporangiaceae bacterium]|jgi:putative ABC transport system permease protein
MRQLTATLRRRPGPLIGTLVALTTASALVTVTASLIGTGGHATASAPAGRLGAATVLVAGNVNMHAFVGSGNSAQGESIALPAYRRVPARLATRVAAVPGVAHVIGDVSFPVALSLPGGTVDTGTATDPLTGHGWSSAALAPLHLVAGTAPSSAHDIVLGAVTAQAAGLHPGDQVRLAGQDLPPVTITGIAAAQGPAAQSLEAGSVFFTKAEAAALSGHPGQDDLLGVIGAKGVGAGTLADRIRAAVPAGYTVVSGSGRGQVADLSAAADGSQLEGLATGVGIDIALVALFVVAGAVALSVGLRRRQFALLRAVGATGGQVRRAVMAELAVLGVLGGVLGYLPGCWLASWTVRAMIGHDMLAAGTPAWQQPWILAIAAGAGVVVAELSGAIAARRAGRARPAEALRESASERWWPHPVRIVLGLGALGGGIAMLKVTLTSNASSQLSLAFPLLLLFMAAVALLGPLLVALAELVVRWPARMFTGVSGRMALAEVAARPRRMASAVIPVALSVAMVGAVYFVGTSQGHAAYTEGRQRLTADAVVNAPGVGLSPAALAAVRAQPGVRDAFGLASANITVADPDLDAVAANVVSPGPLGQVLDLGVASGSLTRFGPGDVAVSSQEVGSGAMGAHLGQMITVYLPDGTPYRARLTAIYNRSLGFGDVLIPAAPAAGHLGGPAGYDQILVRGSGAASAAALPASLSQLSDRFPGLSVASRSVMNAQAEQQDSQDGFLNNLILAVIALLAAIALVNTLVVATVERRDSLVLLRRVGATARQQLAMTAWQSALLSLTGITLGVAAAAVTLAAVCRALTGSWVPYVPVGPALGIAGTAVGLTMAATLGPAAALLRATRDHA